MESVFNSAFNSALDRVSEKFKGELFPQEKMVWTGQPDVSLIFNNSDWILIPFSIFWAAFAFLWEGFAVAGFLGSYQQNQHPLPLILPIFGLPFVFVGFYITVGRFLTKAWKKRRTFYAITNLRVLIITEGRSRTCQSLELKSLTAISRIRFKNGSGTIRFGAVPPTYGLMYNAGFDFLTSVHRVAPPTFYDIQEVDSVYNQLMETRNQGKS